MRKNSLLLFTSLSVLLLASCTANPTEADEASHSSSSSSTASVAPEIRTHTTWNGLTFEYPAGWHILEQYLQEFGKFGFTAELFSPIVAAEDITIHFRVPVVIGPFDSFSDISIYDFVFADTALDATGYAEKLREYNQTGTVTSYTSSRGTKFAVFEGMNINYEGASSYYITTYTDKEGKLHFVEISALGITFEENRENLKQVIESLRYE